MLMEPQTHRSNGTDVMDAARERLQRLGKQYRQVRRFTEHLAAPLAIEDCVVQTMEDVSPTKWHLAHTSWFFEVFVLQRFLPDYELFHPDFPYLFNSYYVQAGERHCRDRRGYITRPTVSDVSDYRRYVDEHVSAFVEKVDAETASEAAGVLEIGIHHEQQHQELILTDIKHVLSVNPLRPVYKKGTGVDVGAAGPLEWTSFDEGIYEIGHDGEGFAYDNESPRHKHYLQDFHLANRPVINGEYLVFMEDGGYERAELWLSMGWAAVQEQEWTEPFYWERRDGTWWTYTLGGMKPVDPDEPVVHLSYFEADAYARWAGARLPTEQEWEVAARTVPMEGRFVEGDFLHPRAAPSDGPGIEQMFGDVWEWTRSQYSAYPGYSPPGGALGEYNGKFMCNQFVLRGGSMATSRTHIRPTYRNFFPPEATWQFTGVRLARD
ncbi:MAG: ergothioneine biosynthesis protein EgtB [Rhodothermales bacterium]